MSAWYGLGKRNKGVRIMHDFLRQIPVEYFILREEYLSGLLGDMPVIKSGKRGDKEVLRTYSDDRKHYRETSSSNYFWKSVKKDYIKRQKIASMLSNVKRLLRNYPQSRRHIRLKVINLENIFDNNFFDSLIDEDCDYKNKTDYFYNGRHYRSRSEMMIAEILDEMGLEFKHDVNISVNGTTYNVDFVIVFREFNRCIFIEFFGMCNDPDYNYDNSIKIESFMNANIYLGRDLIVFSGDLGYTPGADVIKSQLISIIGQLVCYHVREI